MGKPSKTDSKLPCHMIQILGVIGIDLNYFGDSMFMS